MKPIEKKSFLCPQNKFGKCLLSIKYRILGFVQNIWIIFRTHFNARYNFSCKNYICNAVVTGQSL